MKNRYLNHSNSRLSDFEHYINFTRKPLQLVEFGVGSGKTLEEISLKYPKTKVAGFDINPPKHLKKYTIFKADLEKLPIKKLSVYLKKTDIFLLLDILEHLSKPYDFLTQIIKHSKKGSQFIITSPNFASIRMFVAWMKGSMPSEDFGYFDKTHLHWLSPHDDFFNAISFTKVKRSYVFSKKPLFRYLQKIWPRRLCSQFLVVITR
jgi:hypothetical protein